MIKFSIIVPVYNVGKYLDNCINSVIGQTYDNFELLLIDDGSTDNSPEICDNWAKNDFRIRVIHKENGGVGSARNQGLKLATGDYVLFLDADDLLDRELLSFCNKTLKEEYNVINFSYVYKSNNGTISSPFYNFQKQVKIENNVQRLKLIKKLIENGKNNGINPVVWRSCYKLSFLKKNNLFFNETIPLSEDSYFNIKLLLLIDEYIETGFMGYYYNIDNQDSCCNSNPCRGNIDYYNNLALKLYKELKDLNSFIILQDKFYLIHNYIITCAQRWFNISNISQIKNYLDRSIVNSHYVFYKDNIKKALKEDKIKLRELSSFHEYYQAKCYELLKKYSINQNKLLLKTNIILLKMHLSLKNFFYKLYKKLKRRKRK